MSDQRIPIQLETDPARIQNLEATRMGENIIECFTTLKEMERENIFRMPEPVFVMIFLPLFAGEEVKDKSITLERWCALVGNGGYSEVIIHDEKDREKELFRVPPVKNQDFLRLAAAQEGRTFSQIMNMRQRYAEVHPNQGQAYFDQEVNKKDMFGLDPEKLRKEAEQWNMIFTRYGRAPLISSVKAKEPQGKTDLGEIEDYEL